MTNDVIVMRFNRDGKGWFEYFVYLQVLDFDGVGKPAEYMCSNQFPLSTLQEAHSTSDKLELREGSI